MKIIGLTGGIATGKSTASKVLKSKNVPIIDADVIAHQVILPGTSAYRAILRLFGDGVLESGDHPNLPIDRRKLGEIVFADRVKRKQLERITHPAITRTMITQLVFYFFRGYPAIVLDIPLLFESGPILPRICSKIVLIVSSPSVQLSRLMSRDHLTQEQALNRINAQMPLDEKIKRADLIIENDSSLSDLEFKVLNQVYLPYFSSSISILPFMFGIILIFLFIYFVIY